ncbi:hypothetical protein CAPTEDRAFT_193879 [Capitella teleta]|uniref:Uncharacterized protein n=1 Tax=Capitella teleta TaxID=283909 RepID=R7UYV8_CAPTE|nr:hypothetical protein CAPTEDRAFT_193879 [Capitella teleta]|eukprot:ELU11472.1 hypothetical protein CAPTEDRAFT_193879 [Capitella teleta]
MASHRADCVVSQLAAVFVASSFLCLVLLSSSSVAMPSTYAKDKDNRLALSILLAADPSGRDVLEATLPDDPDEFGDDYSRQSDAFAQSMKQLQEKLGLHRVQTRRIQELDSVLPPWQEFCRMLNMSKCGRFKRSSAK